MVNKPSNPKLYEKIKKEAKGKFKAWPSAYASGWLVREYKRRGGKYKKNISMTRSRKRRSVRRSHRRKSVRKSRKRRSVRRSPRRKSVRRSPRTKTGLSRWFKEEWIDVCELPKIVPCGRKSSHRSKRTYPYCRPRYKISNRSPRTAGSLTFVEIRKRCSKKKRNPTKRII